MLLLEVIIHRQTKDATIIPSRARIGGEVSVMTRIPEAGRRCSVMRRMVTTTATMEDVTRPTITAPLSITRPKDVTSIHPSLLTAVHANYLMVSSTQVHVTTKPKTVRSRCSSAVMASAMRIRLQLQRQPIVEPCRLKLFIMAVIACVISRLGHVCRDSFMPTVCVTVIGHQSTLLSRVKSLAVITPMTDAIITRVIVQVTIIRLTVSAISYRVCLHCQPV